MIHATGIIPARYGSTRFPGKVLAELHGRPLIQHVWERVSSANTLMDVYVATDDQRVVDAVEAFGGTALMTSPDHRSGTDRVAEVARKVKGDIFVNVQGDEVLIDPDTIDAVVRKTIYDDLIVCATAASKIRDEEIYLDPNAVKVVVDRDGHALYFSRAPVPMYRDGGYGGGYLHQGIYSFRRSLLEIYASLEPTPLEKAESLEQLRILEHGYRIGVCIVPPAPKGVDTPADLERVRGILHMADDAAT